MAVDERWSVDWARGFYDGFGDVLTSIREMVEKDQLHIPAMIIDELEMERKKLPPTSDEPATMAEERSAGYADGFAKALSTIQTPEAADVREILPELEKQWYRLDVPEYEPFDPAEVLAEDPTARITCHADIVTVVAPLLRGRTRERSVVVACNIRRTVLGCDIIGEGTVSRSLMPNREALVAVLRRDGMAFAIAHNHPSGDPTPSEDDSVATWRMQKTADAVGLRFLGHVVVCDTNWKPVFGLPLRPCP